MGVPDLMHDRARFETLPRRRGNKVEYWILDNWPGNNRAVLCLAFSSVRSCEEVNAFRLGNCDTSLVLAVQVRCSPSRSSPRELRAELGPRAINSYAKTGRLVNRFA